MNKTIIRIAKELTEQQKKTKEVFDSTNIDEQMGKKIKEIAKKWKSSDQKGSYQDFVKKELEKTDVDEKMKKKIKELSKSASITTKNINALATILSKLSQELKKELSDYEKAKDVKYKDLHLGSMDSIGLKLQRYGKDLISFVEQEEMQLSKR